MTSDAPTSTSPAGKSGLKDAAEHDADTKSDSTNKSGITSAPIEGLEDLITLETVTATTEALDESEDVVETTLALVPTEVQESTLGTAAKNFGLGLLALLGVPSDLGGAGTTGGANPLSWALLWFARRESLAPLSSNAATFGFPDFMSLFTNSSPTYNPNVPDGEWNEDGTVYSGTVEFVDADGDVLEYFVTQQPNNGTVAIDPATGAFTFTPNDDYTDGDDVVFQVKARDDAGFHIHGFDSLIALFTGDSPHSTHQTVSVTPGDRATEPVNNAPVVDPSGVVVGAPGEWNLVGGSVGGAFSDPDGDDLTYAVIGEGWEVDPAGIDHPDLAGVPVWVNGNGSKVAINSAGDFLYVPGSGGGAFDSFVVTASDPSGASASVTVDPGAGIPPVNNAPVVDPSGVVVGAPGEWNLV
ncbi:Ig-like domain-containing protein, partial [Gordonia caeni]|uniref:Ig-like domain-containing protein n=1 Tax=Gordonia caeni TaxID=1007097 RepID=UPI0031DCF774